MLVELTNTSEIKKTQREMEKILQQQFPHKQRRIIGWPAGHFQGQVRFSKSNGEQVSWWYTGKSDDGEHIYNLFGRGNPRDSKALYIDLQFNFPTTTFKRTQGGVFLRDIESEQLFIGHRGIVTRGKSRVPREVLLQEANVTPSSAISDVSPKNIEFLLVSPIGDKKLGKLISEFSTEVRRAAYLVMEQDAAIGKSKAKKSKTGNSKGKNPLDEALNNYYDEFTGKVSISRKSHVTMECRHGSVVRALREKLITKGSQYKSVSMDLVVETKNEILLYEVKTGANSQSIYTGIGQLYFHSAALSRRFPNKKVMRHLVIPYAPSSHHRKKICTELGIDIIDYKFLSGKVVFS